MTVEINTWYLAKRHMIPNIDKAHVETVTNTNDHILAPSTDLLNSYKNGDIDWFEYKDRFRQEMLCDQNKREYMFRLYTIAQSKPVWLICYEKDCIHCHRTILKNMIENKEFLMVGEQ